MEMLYRLSYVGAIGVSRRRRRELRALRARRQGTECRGSVILEHKTHHPDTAFVLRRPSGVVRAVHCKRHPRRCQLQKQEKTEFNGAVARPERRSAPDRDAPIVAVKTLSILGAGNGIRTRDPQLGRLTLYH